MYVIFIYTHVGILIHVSDGKQAHPILKVSCTILLSVYEVSMIACWGRTKTEDDAQMQAMKDEQQQDDAIRGLSETLREMICVANDSPDLLTIDGTENVIEAIGRASLQVSSVIDEYARLPFIGELANIRHS